MHFVTMLLLAGCSTPETINGKVVDIWGEPIEGATVLIEGAGERPMTDHEGRYSFSFIGGAQKLKAGKDGYIQDHADMEFKEGDTSGPEFNLYQKPTENGFYLVGPNSYTKLSQQTVETIGTEFDPIRGISKVGDAKTDESSMTLLFHTELKHEEILQLGLELHKLTFVKETTLSGPLGEQEVEVNLFTGESEVEIEITPMRSPTDYLITTKGDLKPGSYAFQTQNLLDMEDQDAFDRIPEAMRTVFSFEYK